MKEEVFVRRLRAVGSKGKLGSQPNVFENTAPLVPERSL
jgi:hypothetical protein